MELYLGLLKLCTEQHKVIELNLITLGNSLEMKYHCVYSNTKKMFRVSTDRLGNCTTHHLWFPRVLLNP
ncbi:unnamed protein product [Leptidea sinapis]|uniref:Uncharacterized protein n=1 Tax=Leptidea sinapis TaxID=189913 RepID=A0A5E4Q3F6_9NEOP|nr:unnamed protein product [Leptidea sinapis]